MEFNRNDNVNTEEDNTANEIENKRQKDRMIQREKMKKIRLKQTPEQKLMMNHYNKVRNKRNRGINKYSEETGQSTISVKDQLDKKELLFDDKYVIYKYGESPPNAAGDLLDIRVTKEEHDFIIKIRAYKEKQYDKNNEQPPTLALFTASVPIEATEVENDPNIHDIKPIAPHEDDISIHSVNVDKEENHDEGSMDNAKLSTITENNNVPPVNLTMFSAPDLTKPQKVEYESNIHDMKTKSKLNHDDVEENFVDFMNEENEEEHLVNSKVHKDMDNVSVFYTTVNRK